MVKTKTRLRSDELRRDKTFWLACRAVAWKIRSYQLKARLRPNGLRRGSLHSQRCSKRRLVAAVEPAFITNISYNFSILIF
jgi:hypothetical protein